MRQRHGAPGHTFRHRYHCGRKSSRLLDRLPQRCFLNTFGVFQRDANLIDVHADKLGHSADTCQPALT